LTPPSYEIAKHVRRGQNWRGCGGATHCLRLASERSLPFVVAGLLNKQTAAELGTSEITIQVHRGQIMRKMAASSLAELVKIAGKLGISGRLAAYIYIKT
jgi:FixJ family two-component response regulator